MVLKEVNDLEISYLVDVLETSHSIDVLKEVSDLGRSYLINGLKEVDS